MSIRSLALLILAAGCLILGTSGCVMRRTVTEGNEVVSQGYVVKSPFNDR